MREIKFRAWDTTGDKWITNIILYFENNILNNIIEFGIGIKDKVKLMQFTGLKDKNGKEIYEGDI